MTNNIIEKAMSENKRIVQELTRPSETTEEIYNGLGRDVWLTYHTESDIEKQLTSDSVVGLIEQFTEQE